MPSVVVKCIKKSYNVHISTSISGLNSTGHAFCPHLFKDMGKTAIFSDVRGGQRWKRLRGCWMFQLYAAFTLFSHPFYFLESLFKLDYERIIENWPCGKTAASTKNSKGSFFFAAGNSLFGWFPFCFSARLVKWATRSTSIRGLC